MIIWLFLLNSFNLLSVLGFSRGLGYTNKQNIKILAFLHPLESKEGTFSVPPQLRDHGKTTEGCMAPAGHSGDLVITCIKQRRNECQRNVCNRNQCNYQDAIRD